MLRTVQSNHSGEEMKRDGVIWKKEQNLREEGKRQLLLLRKCVNVLTQLVNLMISNLVNYIALILYR